MRTEARANQLCFSTSGVIERVKSGYRAEMDLIKKNDELPEIFVISSFPPRECGIATYSQDLVRALETKFGRSFKLTICPLEFQDEKHIYSEQVKQVLNVDDPDSYASLIKAINENKDVQMVMIQHEFGLFEGQHKLFKNFLYALQKPIILVFHTVLPEPTDQFRTKLQELINVCASIIVMTKSSEKILIYDYMVRQSKISVIPHGTHLVPHVDKELLKQKYEVGGKTILSTFGLLSSGKSIETTLKALPTIIKKNPNVLFLIIGKTHPSVVKNEGELYREMLQKMVLDLELQQHVKFINYFLPLGDLLEYLQLTDLYLFTSKDPNQAVSGTFSYAISCGCPIISTPIPHAKEVLADRAGIIVEFENSNQLAQAVTDLLANEPLRKRISSIGLHKMASTAWENTAIAHAQIFKKLSDKGISLEYRLPAINLDHMKSMTTDFGMLQFSKLNMPDRASGYTLDDNARALIAMCQYFELSRDKECIKYIQLYFNFIKHCLQAEGYFLNYVDIHGRFTEQNNSNNLADSNGRAIWALGFMISLDKLLPGGLILEAESTMQKALLSVYKIHSTRAMAFIMKGLFYHSLKQSTKKDIEMMREFADRIFQMYKHESDKYWHWFENYFTYANAILPEAMLFAWLVTGDEKYKDVAQSSFDFLLSKTMKNEGIKVISNNGWLFKGEELMVKDGAEQPIDVAYTILALDVFYEVFRDEKYRNQMELSFSWFLGNNHLYQVIYNPCTGGCYDGLERDHVNLNQGAESTLSYFLARLVVGRVFEKKEYQPGGLFPLSGNRRTRNRKKNTDLILE